MRVELGALVPDLKGETLCVDECASDCMYCVSLPQWSGTLSEGERVAAALYVAARCTGDYRLVAALYVYSYNEGKVLDPALVAAIEEESTVARPKCKRSGEEEWVGVLGKGLIYSGALLTGGVMAVVTVRPEHRTWEMKLLMRRLARKGGWIQVAPWTYTVPRRSLHLLGEAVKGEAVEVLPP